MLCNRMPFNLYLGSFSSPRRNNFFAHVPEIHMRGESSAKIPWHKADVEFTEVFYTILF